MFKPVEIPTLDALAQTPALALELPPEVARALWPSVAALNAALQIRCTQVSPPPIAEPSSIQWLTVEQTAAQFGVTPKWLRANRKLLPCSALNRKRLLFDEAKMHKYLTAHKPH